MLFLGIQPGKQEGREGDRERGEAAKEERKTTTQCNR